MITKENNVFIPIPQANGKYASTIGGLAAMVKYIDGKPLGKDGKSMKDYRRGVVMESNQATTVVVSCVNSSPGIISVTKKCRQQFSVQPHIKPFHVALDNVTEFVVMKFIKTNYETTWKFEVKLLEVLWMISVHVANMGKLKARLLRF
ncbi:hypothetical protein Tco_0960120 [Tanacetum coccineum]